MSASCLKPLNLIRFLRSTWWGSDPNLLLKLYRSLIRSRIEYGAFIWSGVPQYLWKKIQNIQNQAVRLCMGYMNSTPINVMLAEACEPRFVDGVNYLGVNYVLGVLFRVDHPLVFILNDIYNFRENPIFISKYPFPIFV